MTSPEHDEEHFHTHDGEVEVVIPPWVLWVAIGCGLGLGVWLAIDFYVQRRKQVPLFGVPTTVAVVQVPFTPEEEPSVNGQVKTESDENADKVL